MVRSLVADYYWGHHKIVGIKMLIIANKMNTYSCTLPKRQIKITKPTQISIFKTNNSNKKRGQMAIYQGLNVRISIVVHGGQ